MWSRRRSISLTGTTAARYLAVWVFQFQIIDFKAFPFSMAPSYYEVNNIRNSLLRSLHQEPVQPFCPSLSLPLLHHCRQFFSDISVSDDLISPISVNVFFILLLNHNLVYRSSNMQWEEPGKTQPMWRLPKKLTLFSFWWRFNREHLCLHRMYTYMSFSHLPKPTCRFKIWSTRLTMARPHLISRSKAFQDLCWPSF